MPDSDKQREPATMNFQLGNQQKVRWKEYVEESPEFQHLSQLIRQSVEREIASNGVGQSDQTGINEALVESLENSIASLDGSLDDIEARLTSIERRVRRDPDLRELMNAIFEVLPTKDDISSYDSLVTEAGATPPDYVTPSANSGRSEDICAAVEADERRVKQALRELQQDTHQVHSMDHDGETRFYKEG